MKDHTSKCKCFLLLILSITPGSCTLINNGNEKLSSAKITDHNKFISGTIKENKYYSMNNIFAIALPYDKGTVEYEKMDIGEFYHERGSNITFGPFGNNKSVYNIDLFRLKDENNKTNRFEEISIDLLKKYHGQSNLLNTNNEILEKKSLNINGNKALHWSYLEKSNKHPFGHVRHNIFTIQLKYYIAIIVVEKSSENSGDDYYTNAYEFANSLLLLEEKQNQNLISINP